MESTSALAYTQEADSGALVAMHYNIPGYEAGFEPDGLAYSAVPDEQADADTEIFYAMPARRPLLVAGAALASTVFAAASALMVTLALDITPNLVALRPDIGRALTFPLLPPSLPVPIGPLSGGLPPATSQAPVDSPPRPRLNVPTTPVLPRPAPAPLVLTPPDLPAAAPVAAVPVAPPASMPAPLFRSWMTVSPGTQFQAVYISGTYSSNGPPRLMMSEISDASMQWSQPRLISPVAEPAPPQPPIGLPEPPAVDPAMPALPEPPAPPTSGPPGIAQPNG